MILGIIGGNGVAATNKLLEIVENSMIKRFGAYRDQHHPEIIIYQATKAPSRSMYLEGKGSSFVDDYIDIGNKLKLAGANKLCMCCNTAHYAIKDIKKEVGLEFIDMVEETVKKIKKLDIKKIGLMVSDGCKSSKVYEKYVDLIYPNLKIIYPDDLHQSIITRGICNVKNKHRFDSKENPENPENLFSKVYEYFLNLKVDYVLLGCTDISVVFSRNYTISSLGILADSILKECNL